jgi:hypothetical protein
MTHNQVTIATAPPRPALSARVVARHDLGAREVAGMFALLATHFDGVDGETFTRDLDDKHWVVLLADEDGEVRGFSTFRMYGSQAGDRPRVVVYSGDTIVDPSSWGTHALPRAWIRAVYDLRPRFPAGDLCWLLLTSGFRTYRFMSVFCRSFHPRHDAPTPPAAKAAIDALGAERFGDAYDRRTGLVHFARPQMLRGDLQAVPAGRLADPHVRFFLERNPGHARGDEMVSLASLAFDDLTPAGQRMTR